MMAHPSKAKGDMAELEVAKLLSDLTGWEVKRKLGAGRHEDTGDLHGIPDCTIQVKNRPNGLLESISRGLPQLRIQQANAGSRFGFLLARRKGAKWIAVLELDQIAALLVAAFDRGGSLSEGGPHA